MARSLTAAILSFVALIWAGAFVGTSIHYAYALVNPLDNVGFGPHIVPWSDVIFLFARGVAGVAISVLLYRVVKRKPFSLFAFVVSLLIVNGFYLHELWKFVPDARHLKISVFAAMSPVFIVDFSLHLLGLVLWVLAATRGIGGRCTGA